MPALTTAEQKAALAFEDDSVVSSFIGTMTRNVSAKLMWKGQALLTFMLTLAPLLLSLLSATTGPIGLSAGTWLYIFVAVELLHLAELPFALPTAKRHGLSPGRMAARTLLMGYPAWVPIRSGVFTDRL